MINLTDSYEVDAEYCGFNSLSQINCSVTAWNKIGESEPEYGLAATFFDGKID